MSSHAHARREGTEGQLDAATTQVFQLAEGPCWDSPRQRLLWVDILAGQVLEGHLDGASVVVDRTHQFDEMVGAVTVGTDGSLLVAAQESLVIIEPDGSRTQGPRIVAPGDRQRLNDGSTDPRGRFLVGTLSLGDGPSVHERLVRWEPDGGITTLDDDLTLSNGLAWSADGTRFYNVDTERHAIHVREYDAATGIVGERHLHLTVEGGYPDGIAMDVEDHLWVAIWGAGEIRRYSPDRELVATLAVPAPHTSCVSFAGDDLRTLVVTTATKDLSAEQLSAYPDSGRLFTLRTDVPGLPVPAWSQQAEQPCI